MSDTFTAVLECRLQETGGNSDTWGTKLNNEGIQYLEDKIVGITAVSTTGGDTTLTAAQRRSNLIKVTGTLVSNVVLIFSNENQAFKIWNATTDGGFAVTCKTASGTAHQIATIPTNTVKEIYCDGSDGVYRVDDNLIGTVVIVPYGLSTPNGLYEVETVGGVTTVSRTGKWRELFRLYSTTYGSGDGSLTFERPFRYPAGVGDNLGWGSAGTSQGKVCLYL